MEKTILISGATGFIGRHLCKRLREAGYNLIELNSTHSLEDFYEHHRRFGIKPSISVFIHLAAWVKAGKWQLSRQVEVKERNMEINAYALKIWRELCPDARFITMGTSCAYSREFAYGMKEEDYLIGDPDPELWGYADSKRRMLRALQDGESDNWIYLIPSTVYGTDFKDNDHHFIFDLIRKFAYGKLMDYPVDVWGSGEQERELVHVDTVVDAICYFAFNGPNGEVFNIGAGKDFSIKDYVKILSKITKWDEYFFDEEGWEGPKAKRLIIDKIQAQWPMTYPVEDYITIYSGIQEVYWWYVNEKIRMFVDE